jgi:hypothetical protein
MAGLKAVVRKKKPFLFKRHRKDRMDIALTHQHWIIEMVGSDETKINRLGLDEKKWAWKKASVTDTVSTMDNFYFLLYLGRVERSTPCNIKSPLSHTGGIHTNTWTFT